MVTTRHLTFQRLRLAALVVGGVLVPMTALAADVPVSYTLDEKALKTGAPSGTMLSFELHADAACSSAVHTQAVQIDDVALIERLKRLKPRGGAKPPRTDRIVHVLTFAPDASRYFLKLTGPGVTPVGGACQLQLSARSGTDLPCASQVGDEVYFTGCNVNIQDGSGDTYGVVNGRGNLIVGYNESGKCAVSEHPCSVHPDCADDAFPICVPQSEGKTGSHNLIVGPTHGYESYGGLVAGFSNASTGPFASVSGGSGNVASGESASVGGGFSNVASGDGASVGGGSGNSATANSAWVGGGISNMASGINASVAAGDSNVASGNRSSVSGGVSNIASAVRSSITGGQNNQATGQFASVSGGIGNFAFGPHSSVSGGNGNIAGGDASSISGGINNNAAEPNSSISGGSGVGFVAPNGWKAGSFGAVLGPNQFVSQ